ncbi:hypothetical protein [Rhodobacter maris]|uniref:Methyltransferase family protein n=1 Tax=Rhodobacter maris TaxID=446682 RepID=A0A285SHT5_9RHOB|nr:hypothetical protein [Rhodobacter maris]SOC05581.1 hypothetical protein SAMN05877831_104181 [Rhodobacter maris]
MEDKIKPGDLPRMMGAADMALICQIASALPPRARLLEVGPWLGGVSRVLAERGELHVIDRFLWSEKNALNHPGLAEPGASFRPIFEANLAQAPHPVQVHEADFRNFVWRNGQIDLCLIDAPRSAADLLACLRGLQSGLTVESRVLIKNGLSPAHEELPAILEILLGRGILRPVPSRQEAWCTILVVAPGPDWARLEELGDGAAALREEPLAAAVRDPWGGLTLAFARLAERLRRDDMPQVLARLGELPAHPQALLTWDGFERALAAAGGNATDLALLSEILAVQTDPAVQLHLPLPVNRGPVSALRGYWANAAAQPWRGADFDADLLIKAAQQGAMEAPAALRARLFGRRVLEIAPETDLSGVGFLAAGAAAYLGISRREINRVMLAAEMRMRALRTVPLGAFGAQDLSDMDLVVLRAETRTDPAVAQVLAQLPRSLPQLVLRRSRNGAGFESL